MRLREIGSNSRWRVESAGTWAEEDLPPIKEALIESNKRNLDIRSHLSRLIDAKLIKEFDLILVMEAGHKEALLSEFPDLDEKVYLLSEVGGGAAYSIPDPFLSGDSPEEIAAEIEDLITIKFDFICHTLENREASLG
jgi:protein-tyrosine phosphatase